MPTDPFFKFFLLLVFYIILLLVFRFLGLGEKIAIKDCLNACPKCSSALDRIERKVTDKFINHLTFRIFDYKRYKCSSCDWQGLRWEREFKSKP